MKKYSKIPYAILQENFSDVHALRLAIYSHLYRNKEFDINNVRDMCFNNKFSREKIMQYVSENQRIELKDNIIVCWYSTKQYAFCDTAMLFQLRTIAQVKAYMAGQCGATMHRKTLKKLCQCRDNRTLKKAIQKAGNPVQMLGSVVLMQKIEPPASYSEYLDAVSRKNIAFLKTGSKNIVKSRKFWKAQECFALCGGNCGCQSWKDAAQKKILIGNTGKAQGVITQENECLYCRKFRNSPAAVWLAPIWEKYPVIRVSEMTKNKQNQ